jgi:hypothetical protein
VALAALRGPGMRGPEAELRLFADRLTAVGAVAEVEHGR